LVGFATTKVYSGVGADIVMESITLIEAVCLAPLYIAQKPIAASHGKQLKLHDQGSAVFVAHKQKIFWRCGFRYLQPRR
jgi:hypothetical protein